MPGKLYIVGTPIGNLKDITYRAVETLGLVDFIAAEDTRVTQKLLTHFGIKKPLVSYHEHNRKYAGEAIIARITAGETCAVVTDAGMPCISDPGEDIVRLCADLGIPVEVVPGPTAALSALAVSGLDTSKFVFFGFPSTAKNSRAKMFEEAAAHTETLIFYEAPHKLEATLNDLLKYLGDRKISLCRELTKLHEEIIRTTLSEAASLYNDENKPRGEYVLIIEGAACPPAAELRPEDAAAEVMSLVEGGAKLSEACKAVAKKTGFTKGELYSLCTKKRSPD